MSASTLRASHNTRLEQSFLGRTVSMLRRSGWQHPWQTTAQWLPKKKAWVGFMNAGFVNGVCPMVTVTAGELRESRGTFFGQLVDARSGADEIAQLARLAIGGLDDSGLPDGTLVDIPLYQNPPIPLNSWRNIGWDGTGRVPAFFADRGVSDPPPNVGEQLLRGGRIAMDTMTPPKGNRLLRACDIILHKPRAALTSHITLEPSGAVTGSSLVTQTLGLREPSDRDRMRVLSANWDELQEYNQTFRGATNILADDYEERTWDEIPVVTVYLLSPPNAEADATPDPTWQVFTEHKLFWNLHWDQPGLDTIILDDIFRSLVGSVTVLGSGAGAPAVGYLAASLNDATQAAYNILMSNSQGGSFWTPTGGGTANAVPVTVPAPTIPPGLNKAANLANQARAAAAIKRDRRLDPPFPYEGRKFNLSLLN